MSWSSKVLEEARQGKMRIIGPNCLGVMVPHNGLNATFASTIARPGSVGFISQSGALCTAILDWSLRENVGFSSFVSIGSMLDVNWGDLIYYLGDDPNTKSIVIYMESIGDARSFLSAAREVALTKPIIVIKVGRTAAAAKAAASHTGSLTGSDEVLHAAFRRVGVLRVETIAELFHMAEVLAKQPRPQGPRLTILTNAGGPGVLATDMLIGSGGELAEPFQRNLAALNKFLPAAWSHNNPIDILGDAGADRYAKAVEDCGQGPGQRRHAGDSDAPGHDRSGTATAEALKPYAKTPGKPLLACWMGGDDGGTRRGYSQRGGHPDLQVSRYRGTGVLLHVSLYLQSAGAVRDPGMLIGSRWTTATSRSSQGGSDHQMPCARRGRTILTEFESKQLLSAYGIPTVDTAHRHDRGPERCKLAEEIGYPVVLKLYSETITHKTDVGGVQLNLRNAAAVRRAWRAIEARR